MVRTRVGYAGGEKENPTYRSLGSHSETIQIDYDPSKISYRDLLSVFWDSHNPVFRPVSQQYASIIFYHNEEQKALAEETKSELEARRGHTIYTLIVPFSRFYLAEDYHQKYYLRQDSRLAKDFEAIYPDVEDFISSTSAARVNGYLGGYGDTETLQNDIDSFGLSEGGKKRLLDIAGRGLTQACPVPFGL